MFLFSSIRSSSVFLLAALATLLFTCALAAPLLPRDAVSIQRGPSLSQDFPDPAVLEVNGQWYAYATNTKDRKIHVQVATLDHQSNTWSILAGHDVLPDPGLWVNASIANVWAPDVIQRDDGDFLLYYSAMTKADKYIHCVGTAYSSSPLGPFHPNPSPFACPLSAGGAIDASSFRDTDRTRYVVYKVDGNSIGHGGSCNNLVAPLQTTPIMLQAVAEDGFTPLVGRPAVQILDRLDEDGPLVEAPNIMRADDGTYVLFYSNQCYVTPEYAVLYATAPAVTGPYTRRGKLFATGTLGLNGPGGAQVDRTGRFMTFHANCPDGRCMYFTEIGFAAGKVSY